MLIYPVNVITRHFEISFRLSLTYSCLVFGSVLVLHVTHILSGHENRGSAARSIGSRLNHIRSVLGDWFVTAASARQLADD